MLKGLGAVYNHVNKENEKENKENEKPFKKKVKKRTIISLTRGGVDYLFFFLLLPDILRVNESLSCVCL